MKSALRMLFVAMLMAGFVGLGSVPQGLGQDDPELGALLEGTKPAQWRLLWRQNPAEEATLSWSTAEPAKVNRVYFDTQSRAGRLKDYAQQQSAQNNGRLGNERTRPEIHYHHARLTDLKPETTYYVVMESDGETSPELHFRTAPTKDQPFSLLYGGDSRSDRRQRRNVNMLIRSLVEKQPGIVGFAHGGDFIATGTDLNQWNAWLTDWELTVTKDGRLLPLIAARGNHDWGDHFNPIFDFPAKDENYYTINLGPEVALVTLNSNISHGGSQQEWLEGQLKQVRPAFRWVIVNYHRPAFPAVKGPGPARQFWVPLFEKYNVDLVCESDGHVFKRTVPIRNEKADPTGVVYVGEGGLGVGQRTPRTDRWYLEEPGKTASAHHVQLLDFNAETLKVRTIVLDGSTLDEFDLKVRK